MTICLVGNPVEWLLHHKQHYFHELGKSGASPAVLWHELVTNLSNPVVMKGAGVDPELGQAAATMVDELSAVFPPSVANHMREAFLAAYEGGQRFGLTTEEAPDDVADEFKATGRVRVIVDFDEGGVDMTVQHVDRHADWYQRDDCIPKPGGYESK